MGGGEKERKETNRVRRIHRETHTRTSNTTNGAGKGLEAEKEAVYKHDHVCTEHVFVKCGRVVDRTIRKED